MMRNPLILQVLVVVLSCAFLPAIEGVHRRIRGQPGRAQRRELKKGKKDMFAKRAAIVTTYRTTPQQLPISFNGASTVSLEQFLSAGDSPSTSSSTLSSTLSTTGTPLTLPSSSSSSTTTILGSTFVSPNQQQSTNLPDGAASLMTSVVPPAPGRSGVSFPPRSKGSIRKGMMGRSGKSKSKKGRSGGGSAFMGTVTITVTNIAYNQPLGPFFVMVHNAQTMPLFTMGTPASDALALLAENGDPVPLTQLYSPGTDPTVLATGIFSTDAPYGGGRMITMQVQVSFDYNLVTIASKILNTNDGFIAINGFQLVPGMVLELPGLDAGSEINNESCDSIPGPACDAIASGNVRSGNGENFVHTHRGFFGTGSLQPQSNYDWNNPMVRVDVN